MKKIIALFLIALLGFTAQAQDPELIDNNWYVDYIIVNGVTYESPIPGFPLINTNLDFYTDNCAAVLDPDSDSFFAEISYDPVLDEVTMTEMGITLPGCYNYCDFAPFYWDFLYGDGIESHFTYEITSNTDGTKGLQITHDSGDIGVYNNFPPLGINDHQKLIATIYPNPVSDIVHIITDEENVEKYQIYDLTGKTVGTSSLIGTSIDVSYVRQGVYFLEISSKNATGIYKIVKN